MVNVLKVEQLEYYNFIILISKKKNESYFFYIINKLNRVRKSYKQTNKEQICLNRLHQRKILNRNMIHNWIIVIKQKLKTKCFLIHIQLMI
jgi:hypothetical protein